MADDKTFTFEMGLPMPPLAKRSPTKKSSSLKTSRNDLYPFSKNVVFVRGEVQEFDKSQYQSISQLNRKDVSKRLPRRSNTK